MTSCTVKRKGDIGNPSLKIDDQLILPDVENADHFNDYFKFVFFSPPGRIDRYLTEEILPENMMEIAITQEGILGMWKN